MMKRFGLVLAAVLVGLSLIAADADAARMGGGRSFGMQRSIPQSRLAPAPVAPRAATPAQPAAPAAQAPARATPAAPASGMRRWLGPIAGIAAGLGLAALLSHFGMSPDLGGLLLVVLLVIAGVFLVRMFLARRSGTTVYQGAPSDGAAMAGSTAAAPDGARAAWNGGAIDSSASRVEPAFEPAPNRAATGAAEDATFTVPAGFDVEGFLVEARRNFNRVQAAYDNGDRRTLANIMTPEMLKEVESDLDRREKHEPTEIVRLDADLVDLVTERDQHVASVRFRGLLREDGRANAEPFEEIWHIAKPIDDSHGWLLAGIQQLETTR